MVICYHRFLMFHFFGFIFLIWLIIHTPSSPGWYDTAELTTALFNLDVSHPPGQPFYMMLGNLVSMLPIGSIGFRTNFFSGICIWLSGYSLREIIQLQSNLSKNSKEMLLIWGFFFCLPQLLLQSTRTELYALSFLLGTLCVWQLIVFQKTKNFRVLLILEMLVVFLSFVHSFLSVLIVMILTVPLLFQIRKKDFWHSAHLLAILPIFISLYPYARSYQNLPINWGKPSLSLNHFFRYLSADDYQGSLSIHKSVSLFFGPDLWMSIHPFFLFLILISLLFLFMKRKEIPIVWICGMVFSLSIWLVLPFVKENPDAHGYLTSFWIFAIPVVVHFFSELSKESSKNYLVTSVLVGLILFGLTKQNHFKITGDQQTIKLQKVFQHIPTNAQLILKSDHYLFSSWFLQNIRGLRPDLNIFGEGFRNSSWYQDRWNLFNKEMNTTIVESIEQSIPPQNLLIYYFTSESREALIQSCQSSKGFDPYLIQESICAQVISQWAQQLSKIGTSPLQIIQYLELATSGNIKSSEDKNCRPLKIPFPLMQDEKPIFLKHPDFLKFQLMLYYLECNSVEKAKQIYTPQNQIFNTHLLNLVIMATTGIEKEEILIYLRSIPTRTQKESLHKMKLLRMFGDSNHAVVKEKN